MSKNVCVNLFGLRDILDRTQPNSKAIEELATRAFLEGSKLDVFQYSPFFEIKKMNRIRTNLYSLFNKDLSNFKQMAYEYELEVLRLVIVNEESLIDEKHIVEREVRIEIMRVALYKDINTIIHTIDTNMKILDIIQYSKSNQWSRLYEKWTEK